ncbi:MAG: hypothetical protein V7L25_33275 [Nostoc sp.]
MVVHHLAQSNASQKTLKGKAPPQLHERGSLPSATPAVFGCVYGVFAL